MTGWLQTLCSIEDRGLLECRRSLLVQLWFWLKDSIFASRQISGPAVKELIIKYICLVNIELLFGNVSAG